MSFERSHQNLEVWKKGMRLVQAIYKNTTDFPPEEKYGFTSQIRRASISIPTNISEGAARDSHKEFLRFLYISRGSISEVETLLILARNLEILSRKKFDILIGLLDEISPLLSGLIKKIKKNVE